jgi:hypothetical protein
MKHLLSLGAGVQSSTLALMAAVGEVAPMPDAANFSDTKAEPQSVYQWLEWLEKQLPFPVRRLTNGSLTDAQLLIRKRTKTVGGPWSKSLIPAFVKNSDGTKGIMGRGCTVDHKIVPLIREAKKAVGPVALREWKKSHSDAYKAMTAARKAKRACPSWAWDEMQADALVEQWIGISLDEVQRMKPARDPWIRHRWPLIEKEMTRHDCLRWMDARGYPKPPRSACVYCPFHSDSEWRRLQKEEPAEFERAVKFERDLQDVKRVSDNLNGVPFLHSSLKPLGEVDFTTDQQKGQGVLHGFGAEREGLCGV